MALWFPTKSLGTPFFGGDKARGLDVRQQRASVKNLRDKRPLGMMEDARRDLQKKTKTW